MEKGMGRNPGKNRGGKLAAVAIKDKARQGVTMRFAGGRKDRRAIDACFSYREWLIRWWS
jgi:hypothetical protein